jgi:hypothetical protein
MSVRGTYPGQRLAWPDKTTRNTFFNAMTNMAEGRPWNKSAQDQADEVAQAKAEQEAERKRVEFDAQSPAEPEPETDLAELDVMSDAFKTWEPAGTDGDGAGGEMPTALPRIKTIRLGPKGLAVCSHPFSDYFQKLQMDKSNPVLCSDQRITDEVTAEAFRIWALLKVTFATQINVERVNTALRNAMFDVTSKDAIFSGSKIFETFRLTEMVEKHHKESMERLEKGIRGPRKTPGPDYLLWRNDMDPAVRKKKTQELELLAETIQKFQKYGVSPNDAGRPLDPEYPDYGYD